MYDLHKQPALCMSPCGIPPRGVCGCCGRLFRLSGSSCSLAEKIWQSLRGALRRQSRKKDQEKKKAKGGEGENKDENRGRKKGRRPGGVG